MAADEAARNLTPRRASGMRATMTRALKITADSTALSGLCSFMMLSAFEVWGRQVASGGEQRRDDGEVLGHVVGDGEGGERTPGDEQLLADLDDVDELGRVGVEVDHVARPPWPPSSPCSWPRPTSAWASAGASLVPSPVMATSLPPSCSARMRAILASGVASARKSSTPASWAMAAAVSGLSPVIITVRMPIWRISSNFSLMPCFTTSFSSMTPRIVGPSATTSGRRAGPGDALDDLVEAVGDGPALVGRPSA